MRRCHGAKDRAGEKSFLQDEKGKAFGRNHSLLFNFFLTSVGITYTLFLKTQYKWPGFSSTAGESPGS
jgi:hypothetical protein